MNPFRLTSGIRAASLALLIPVLQAGCLYSFQAGAGFPDYVKTVAIVPFENGPDVTRPEITDELFQQLLREFPRSQGLQPAGEDVADAVVRGTIRRYDISTPSYRAGAAGDVPQVLQRQVTLIVEVQIINQIDNEILWESPNLSVQGQYLEETENEDIGRAMAIELLVQRIVDGAQSNW
ncbi:LPS assembly lipoprotein LptE [Gemmatimonadota bacterium]